MNTLKRISKILGIAASLTVLFSSQSFALYADLNWPWYVMSGTTSCSSNLEGKEAEDQIWNYLTGPGKLGPKQAAALMGNMSVESSFNPRVNNGGQETDEPISRSTAYGIVQWLDSDSNSPGGRQTNLVNKAHDASKITGDLEIQLAYTIDELNGGYKDSVLTPISGSDDLQYMVHIIWLIYEAPGLSDPTEPDRYDEAVRILQEHGDSLGGGGFCNAAAGTIPGSIKLQPPLATPGGQITPKGVTLHWWGSGSNGQGIQALVNYLKGNSSCGASGCSVQIGITADGKVYQMTNSLTDLTYHATGANSTTFGIEIEGGPSDFGANGPTKYPEMFNSVVNTVKYLISAYHLPIDGEVICGDVSGVHPHKAYNSCPGALAKIDVDDAYFNAVMAKVRQ